MVNTFIPGEGLSGITVPREKRSNIAAEAQLGIPSYRRNRSGTQEAILHRDISANNLLLDIALSLKLSDFQGRVLAPNGVIIEDGLSVECTKSFMPRADSGHVDWRTEIFALGSAI